MGFPMVQVFMIAARQVSKPVADAVLRYGKDHPGFRNRLLIPIGKSIVRLTQRFRMKQLGLGDTSAVQVQVSEAAALEQASDFVQQLVIFTYSLGVFTAYYFYTTMTASESLKLESFEEYREEHKKVIDNLNERLKNLEDTIENLTSNSSTVTPGAPRSSASVPSKLDTSDKKYPRVSSLPIDQAVEVVLKDIGQFLIVRSGTSVGIEDAFAFQNSKRTLRFAKKELIFNVPRPGLIGFAESLICKIFGQYTDV